MTRQWSIITIMWTNMKNGEFKKDYPYIVVPFDENEKEKANKKGIPNTFCASINIAIEVKARQDKYSGVFWRIKRTENEVLDWSLL